ncbi:MAG: NUDIX hydrolase [Pseudomonadota bacterium]
MIPRYGEQPRPDRKYTLRPGVYAILPLRGAILLTFQSQPAPEIQLPGGGIDPGESPVRALHREVMEETGWRIGAPRLLGSYRRFTFMPEYDLWAEKLCHIFVARPARADGPPLEPDHTVLWLPNHEASQALQNDADAQFLRRYLR